jgi:membrane glycosyltransferase
LLALHGDPKFRALHEAYLPPAPHRERGDITPERAMAFAKLVDAHSIGDAARWLHRRERSALLHDRALIARLARLPADETPPPR